MPSPNVIFSPFQCVSCNPINGAWYTIPEYVTRAFCEQIGGSTSVVQPDRSDANDLTLCGNNLTAPNCSQYYGFTRPGAQIVITKPWVILGGTVEVNACNIRESNFSGSIPVYYDSLDKLRSSCEAFGALHPQLNLCVARVDMHAPITIENTNITEIFQTTPVTTSSPLTYGIPITVISVGVGTVLYKWFTTPGAPPPGPPPTFNPIGLQPSAAIGALKALKAIFGAATGVIFGPILVRPDPVGGGQVASYGIILYNSDGTSSNTLITEIPL